MPTEDELDSLAQELIPMLDEVIALSEETTVMPELDVPDDFVPPPIRLGDEGVMLSAEAEQLVLAIDGQAAMVMSTPASLRDGSYRIVLSPSKNWVVQSMMMSGLDSSTEIVLILAPKI